MHDLTSDRIRARLIEYPAGPATPEERRDLHTRRFAALETEIARRISGGKPSEAPWATPSMSAEGIVQAAFNALRHLPSEAVIRLIAMGQLLRTKFGDNSRTITATITTATATSTTTTTTTTKENCEHVDQEDKLTSRVRRREIAASPPGQDSGDDDEYVPAEQGATALSK